MNLEKIVFIYYQPLNAGLERLYALDFLRANAAPVEYWDLSPLYGFPGTSQDLDRPYSRRVDSWPAFDSALRESAPERTLLVPCFALEPKTAGVYRRISARKSPLAFFLIGEMPWPKPSAASRLRQDLRHLWTPGKLGHFLRRRMTFLQRKMGWIKNYDVVFAAGEAAREAFPAALVVGVNHPDYDEWLASRESDPRLVEGRYAVYLDEFLPYHPDLRLVGLAPGQTLDAERHYALLNRFFSNMEKRHGVEIVVAAHPKSVYPKNPFGGRRILRGSTRQLVRSCEFAVSIHSSSINYAVLDRKPLVFMTPDAIASRLPALRLDVFPSFWASTLGMASVHLREGSEPEACPLNRVDSKLYDDFKYRYLVSRESEDRESRSIYLDFFLGGKVKP